MKTFFTSVKAIFLACFFILISIVVNAQSGEKWATGGNSVSNGGFVGTTNYYPFIAKVNNTEYLRITPTGNVGISNTDPVYRLDVNGRFHVTGNIFADSSITAMHLYAIQKVSCDALQVNNNSQFNGIAVFGNKVTIDGVNSSITSSSGEISFGNNNLTSVGSLQSTGNISAGSISASSISTSSIFATGECRFSLLAGSGKKLLQADSLGNIIPFSFSGNTANVLLGNGTWGTLPQKSPWIADSNGIFPDSTLANTDIFVERLFASRSVSIGTFRFKNGALPGERDTISAERGITITAPSRIEFNADTLTMKNSVGIGVANPQSALDVAGDINTSGTVYASNLYAQNSIAIGTLKISNGAELPPGAGKDTISTPYKLALVSAGREISLLSDTVKIGDYNSTVRFDVNGSVRVRDVLWVETGLIVGKKFEGDKADVDTVDAKKVAAENVVAQTAEALRIYADSAISAISKTDSMFTIKLGVAGDAKIKGNAEITGNLKVSGSLTSVAGFDSLHVLNNLKIGNTLQIDSLAGVGFKTDSLSANSYKLVFADQNGNLTFKTAPSDPTSPHPCQNQTYSYHWMIGGNPIDPGFLHYLVSCVNRPISFVTNSSERMIITGDGRVGIGTIGPVQKLHIVGNSYFDGNVGIGAISPSQKLQVDKGNILVKGNDNFGSTDNEATLYLGDANHYIRSIYGTGIKIGTYGVTDAFFIQQETGKVGIGTTNLGLDEHTMLTVEGNIDAREFVAVAQGITWPDFVFQLDYDLMSLPDLENYITINKHLPKMPTASEVEKNGIALAETNAQLLQKVEELTLYLIEQNKKIEKLQMQVDELKKK